VVGVGAERALSGEAVGAVALGVRVGVGVC